MKKLILSSLLCILLLVGGFLAYRHQTRVLTNQELIVAISKHMAQVELLKDEGDYYLYKVTKVYKGDSSLLGKELRQKKYNNYPFVFNPIRLLFIKSVESEKNYTPVFPNKYVSRFPDEFFLTTPNLFSSVEKFEAFFNKQTHESGPKIKISDIQWRDAIFRKYEQANDIFLIKVLDEKKDVKRNVFKNRVIIERVLKGNKTNENKVVFLQYYYKDVLENDTGFPSVDIEALLIPPLSSNNADFDSKSPPKETRYRCETLNHLEKDRRYIIQVSPDSVWEDKDTLRLEKKYPQYSSLVECEVVEDDSPFFDLVLESF